MLLIPITFGLVFGLVFFVILLFYGAYRFTKYIHETGFSILSGFLSKTSYSEMPVANVPLKYTEIAPTGIFVQAMLGYSELPDCVKNVLRVKYSQQGSAKLQVTEIRLANETLIGVQILRISDMEDAQWFSFPTAVSCFSETWKHHCCTRISQYTSTE